MWSNMKDLESIRIYRWIFWWLWIFEEDTWNIFWLVAALMKYYIKGKHDDDNSHTDWANPVADSGGYDHKEHGLSSTKLRSFLWACWGRYGVYCGKRTSYSKYWMTGKHDCKMTCTALCWTAAVAVTVTSISRQSWHLWTNQLAEACASLWYTGG